MILIRILVENLLCINFYVYVILSLQICNNKKNSKV